MSLEFAGSQGACSSYDAAAKFDLIASPIYNRKHSLGAVTSVTHFGWSVPQSVYDNADYSDRTLSMPIPETSESFGKWIDSFANTAGFYRIPLGEIQTCGGSAEWEAGPLAGAVRNNTWISSPQTPFYNSYDEYNQHMRLKNQDYSSHFLFWFFLRL